MTFYTLKVKYNIADLFICDKDKDKSWTYLHLCPCVFSPPIIKLGVCNAKKNT